MAVRKQCNRYRTEPHGYDYKEVLKKGKAFYTYNGYWEGITHDPFEMSCYDGLWIAHKRTLPGFRIKEGTIIVEWDIDKKRWYERGI